MKYAFALAAVAGLAAANAHNGHDRLHRRGQTVTDWTVVTVTDVVTVYGPSPVAQHTSAAAVPNIPASSPAAAAPVASSPAAEAPAQASTSAAPAAPVVHSQPAAVSAPVAASPAQQQTTLATQVAKPQSAPAAVNTPAAASTPAAAATPAAGSSSSSGSSSDGNFGLLPGASKPADCPKDKPCNGQATYYDVGQGSCGYTDVASDAIVAINAEMWGSMSNFGVNSPSNKLCDKMITIKLKSNGNTVVGKIRDKCLVCHGESGIDLSSSLQSNLTGLGAGGSPEVEWWFN